VASDVSGEFRNPTCGPLFLQRYETTEFKGWGSANDMILLNLEGSGDKRAGKRNRDRRGGRHALPTTFFVKD